MKNLFFIISHNKNLRQSLLSKFNMKRKFDTIFDLDLQKFFQYINQNLNNYCDINLYLFIFHKNDLDFILKNLNTSIFLNFCIIICYQSLLNDQQILSYNQYFNKISDFIPVNISQQELSFRLTKIFQQQKYKQKLALQQHIMKNFNLINNNDLNIFSDEIFDIILKDYIQKAKKYSINSFLHLISFDIEFKGHIPFSDLIATVKKFKRSEDFISIDENDRIFLLSHSLIEKDVKSIFYKIQNILRHNHITISMASINLNTKYSINSLKTKLADGLREALLKKNSLLIIDENDIKKTQQIVNQLTKEQINIDKLKADLEKTMKNLILPIFFQVQKSNETKLLDTKISIDNSDLSSYCAFLLTSKYLTASFSIKYSLFSKIKIHTQIITQKSDKIEKTLHLETLDSDKLYEALNLFIKLYQKYLNIKSF